MSRPAVAVVAVVAAVTLTASGCGGGSGGGASVSGTPIASGTVRTLADRLSKLPIEWQYESCPMITTERVNTVYKTGEPSSAPLDLAQPLAESTGGQFVPRGAVDVKNGPKGAMVDCTFTGGQDNTGLTVVVATGADAQGSVAKMTKGEDVEHRGTLTWGAGTLVSAESSDVLVGVLTESPLPASQPLDAAATYRVGVAVLGWLRGHLARVADSVGPPTCSAIVDPPAAPGAEAYARAVVDAYRAVVPIDASLRRQNGDFQPADAQAQIAVEEKFIAAVSAIHFEGDAATDVAKFLDAERTYVDALRQREQARAQPDGIARFRQPVADARSKVGDAGPPVRRDLGIPDSTCSLRSV